MWQIAIALPFKDLIIFPNQPQKDAKLTKEGGVPVLTLYPLPSPSDSTPPCSRTGGLSLGGVVVAFSEADESRETHVHTESQICSQAWHVVGYPIKTCQINE